MWTVTWPTNTPRPAETARREATAAPARRPAPAPPAGTPTPAPSAGTPTPPATSLPRPGDGDGDGEHAVHRPRRVAFLSDFGTTDEFVGVVHAVVDTHAPGGTIIDVTHAVAPHDVRAGALALWRAAPWLAPAVILGVVDPGVGTARRAVAIEVPSAQTVLVGPDNGLLLPAALHLGPITTAVELPPATAAPGETFHGRDVFAPAAGRAAAGVPVAELGEPIDPATLAGERIPEPAAAAATPDAALDAEVLWIDHFGNAQLNVTPAHTGHGPLRVRTSDGRLYTMRVVSSYGAIAPDEFALVVDSYGFLSVSCDRRPAAERLGLRSGDPVRLAPDVTTSA